jgi:hypothetical protein
VDLVTIIVSATVSLFTGGLAGAFINQKFRENESQRRRKRVLAGLRRQLADIGNIVEQNKTATAKPNDPPLHVPPMLFPIVPFETAIFSDNAIGVAQSTIDSAGSYIMKARELNTLIEILIAQIGKSPNPQIDGTWQQMRRFIYCQCTSKVNEQNEPVISMVVVWEKLSQSLKDELDEKMV